MEISDPEKELTKRVEERTVQLELVINFIQSYFWGLILSFFLFLSIAIGSFFYYTSLTTNTMPCKDIDTKLKAFDLPEYFELRPVPRSAIKPSIKGN